MFRLSAADVDRSRHGHSMRYKQRYSVNEINLLGAGDVLLLATDGLLEHGGGRFHPDEIERVLAAAQDEGAAEIAARVVASLRAFAEPEDDVSFVVIKKV